MTAMEGYLVQAIVVCVFIFVMFFWSWALKNKYQKQSIDHVFGEFVTKEGTGYPKILRVEGGLVTLEPDVKKGIKGKTFPVAEKCTYLVDYPEGSWCPRFLKCKIKKIVLREFDLEPVSNLYDEELVITPEVLYNIKREGVTEIGARIAEKRAEELGVKPTKSKFGGAKLWLFLIGIGLVGIIIYLLSTVTQLRQALGI